jgi:hypothetical protein
MRLNRFSVLMKANAIQRNTILPFCQVSNAVSLDAHTSVWTLNDVGGRQAPVQRRRDQYHL